MNLLFAESYDEKHSLDAKSNDNMKKSLLQLTINKIPISQDAANIIIVFYILRNQHSTAYRTNSISRLTCQSYTAW